jgi:hypothetical protein
MPDTRLVDAPAVNAPMVNAAAIAKGETPAISPVSWPAILAGAAVTASLSLALLALGAGLGFSVADPWAGGSGITSTRVATIAGIYFAATAVLASAVGGYLSGRLRELWPAIHPHEAFFRDTAHGLATWAVATLVSAAFLGSAISALSGSLSGRTASFASADPPRDAALSPFIDRLFSYNLSAPDEPTAQLRVLSTLSYADDSAMAGRLLRRLVGSENDATMTDRRSLAVLVMMRTGVTAIDAEQRVLTIEADAQRAAQTAHRAAMMLSLWICAGLLAGAFTSSLAAWEGGAVRDGRLKYGSSTS